MTRPTIEQIAEARKRVAQLLAMGDVPMNYIGDVMTLLAATEPPTDEEIADVCASAHQSMGGVGDFAALKKAHAKALAKPNGNFYASFVGYALRRFLGPVKP